jgi:dihydrofolate reductase
LGELTSFNYITLNGYFEDSRGYTSWHRHGAEEADFSAESLKSGNTLLFGRVTYEHMVSFWPTEMAAKQYPNITKVSEKDLGKLHGMGPKALRTLKEALGEKGLSFKE